MACRKLITAGKLKENKVVFLPILKKLFGGSETPPESAKTMSRNAPCWCGSGNKYKHCHFEKDRGYLMAKQNEACKGPT